MAATAAAILPSREDPRAALRIARTTEQRRRQERAAAPRSFGELPALNVSLGGEIDSPSPANNDAAFRTAQHRERLRRQVGSAVPFYPQPEETGGVDESMIDESVAGNLQAIENTYASSMLGLDNRAVSAVRGEMSAYGEKAVEAAFRQVSEKGKEIAQRWMISLGKNAAAVTESVPWAAYIIQFLTWVYDNIRAAVTIFVPDPGDVAPRTLEELKAAMNKLARKIIRVIFPPFSLMEPVGLIGFIFQSLMVVAILTIVFFLLLLIPTLAAGLGYGAADFFFGE